MQVGVVHAGWCCTCRLVLYMQFGCTSSLVVHAGWWCIKVDCTCNLVVIYRLVDMQVGCKYMCVQAC